MKIKKLLSAILSAAVVIAAIPAMQVSADSGYSVTTNAGNGQLVAYYGQYVYYDYNYTTYESKEIKSMVEGSYVSGDTVGHIGHYAWRDGYGFAGWAEKENGTPIDLTSYKVTKNITLYPVWSNDYSNITIKDGRYLNGVFAIANGSSLKPFALREAYDKRAGYAFKGFATKKDSKNVIDIDTYKVTKDVTLYPVYSGVGKTVKDDEGNKYTVTKVGSMNTTFCVEFKAPKNKNIKSIVVPSGIYDDEYNYYSVDGIAAGALKDCKKLKKAVVQYPLYIGTGAFAGCDKLKDIAILTYMTDKKAFKNCFKNSSIKTVHCYKDNVSEYKKVFTKKVTGSSGKIKIVGDFVGY
ncbi:MAG: InlB B-repeat-containing protein [Lachnospiraceae bacterium]|nr:InlB B-repeat-containing protein [Lachnospiraceae bacterium]